MLHDKDNIRLGLHYMVEANYIGVGQQTEYPDLPSYSHQVGLFFYTRLVDKFHGHTLIGDRMVSQLDFSITALAKGSFHYIWTKLGSGSP